MSERGTGRGLRLTFSPGRLSLSPSGQGEKVQDAPPPAGPSIDAGNARNPEPPPKEDEGQADPSPTPPTRDAVVWHEVECGAYEADLGLWEELADEAAGEILELGCGTGRVGLHLARRGHPVTGIDRDAALVAAFEERAEGLPATAAVADARELGLGREFGLVLAPMQLVQLLGGEGERVACLSCAARHLRPRGTLAVAIVEDLADGTGVADGIDAAVTPDVREADGWVYSSLPLEIVAGDGEIALRRLRQTVAPGGELGDEVCEVRLRALDAATLEREAETAGLRPAGRRTVPPTDAHAGSTVVLLARGS